MGVLANQLSHLNKNWRMGESVIQREQNIRCRNDSWIMTPCCNKQTVVTLYNNNDNNDKISYQPNHRIEIQHVLFQKKTAYKPITHLVGHHNKSNGVILLGINFVYK